MKKLVIKFPKREIWLMAKRKIDMSQIGRKVFLGEDGIKGDEYRNGARIIEEALRENILGNGEI